MKNLKTFALSALSLFGFAACQQVEIAPDVTPEATHTVTFVAGAPETKTTVDISDGTAKFAWTEDDKSRFTVYENGVPATTITAGITDGIMSMLAEFPGDVPSSPKYQALFNSEVSATQIVTENSYAETTDVMISEVLDGTRNDNFVFRFKREVAFAKMTLKNLSSGAYVSSVKISSDKPIAGKYNVKTGTFEETSNDITLDVFNTVSDGTATVWFTTIPVEDATFTITVETTDDAETVAGTFTKTFSQKISLTRGNVTSFGVAMEKDAPKTYGYQKISSVEDYAPGDYIIVAHVYKEGCPTTGDFAIANDLSLSSKKLLGKEVTNLIDNDVISVSDGASYKLSLSGNTDNIVISNGTKTLAANSSSSTDLVLNGNNKYWTLSLNEGNGGTFQLLNNSTNRALLFQSYSTSGSSKTASLKFAAYAASNINNVDYAAIELYKYQEVTPPTPKYSIAFAEVTGGTLSATPSKAEAGAEVTLTATPSSSAYEFDGNWTVTAADGSPVTVSGTGTTATFVMPAQNVSVTGSFSAKAEPLATFDQIFALASEYGTTKGDASIKFNNWVVSGVKNSNVYLTDGQKGCIIYTSDHGFEKGDILSGTVACKLMLYKGSAEIVDLTSTTEGLTVNKGGALTPVSIPISNLSGVNTGALLSFSGLTYNGSVFSDGTNTITPYNTFITLPSLKTGNKYNVTGVYIQYNSTKEISPLSADDIQEQEVTKYAITIDSNIQNGTVSASVDSASEGAVITLTATANTGYKFDNWNVMDAEGNAISVTSNKFTMPASAVTVSANFVEGKEEQKFSKTYAYGSFETGWSLTNYSDKKSYYLVPNSGEESIATISGIFAGKTLCSDVVVTLNVATFGNGDNPSNSTFSLYTSENCTENVTSTQGGTLPTSSAYTNVTYTVSAANAAAFVEDLSVKITKPGKQIRLKSIEVEFSYTDTE